MKNNINITGQIVATITFVISTSLTAFFLYFGEHTVLNEFVFSLLVTIIVVNIVTVTTVLSSILLNTSQRKQGLKTCTLLLANIPIAILYTYIMVTFPRSEFF